MRYRVIWDPDAFRGLLRAWIAANKPEAGIRAFDAIEESLSEDAHDKGESREGERRILIVRLLGVISCPLRSRRGAHSRRLDDFRAKRLAASAAANKWKPHSVGQRWLVDRYLFKSPFSMLTASG